MLFRLVNQALSNSFRVQGLFEKLAMENSIKLIILLEVLQYLLIFLYGVIIVFGLFGLVGLIKAMKLIDISVVLN